MRYRLTVTTLGGVADELGAVFDFDADEVIVGRGASAAVRLPHPDVAAEAICIQQSDEGVVAVARAGGCQVEPHGLTLAIGARHRLVDGDVLVVAERFQIAFAGASPPGIEPTGPERTASLARALVREILANQAVAGVAGPRLVGASGVAAGQVFPIPVSEMRTVIGRGQSCAVLLPDPDLSREHAALVSDPRGFTIADLDSKNGTAVDGARLSAHQPVRLTHDAVVALGACTLRFVDPTERYLRQLDGLAEAGGDPADESPPGRDVAGAPRAEPRPPSPLPRAPSPLPMYAATVIALIALAAIAWLLLS